MQMKSTGWRGRKGKKYECLQSTRAFYNSAVQSIIHYKHESCHFYCYIQYQEMSRDGMCIKTSDFSQPKAMKNISLFDVSSCGSPGAEPEEVGQPHWPGSHNQCTVPACASPHNPVTPGAENGSKKKSNSLICGVQAVTFSLPKS